MACNAASPVSTREDTNYALLKHLLVRYGTRVLRNLFDEKIPPDKLKDHLSRKEDNEDFMRLKTDGTLTTRDTLLLEKPEPSSSSYDVQLLTKLLSCLCDLRPPWSTGDWKKFPRRDDESISAYIVRMRYYRNEIHGHETSTSMDDKEFEKNWKKISRAVIALAGREKERYTNEIRNLKQRGRESHETIQKLENLEGIVQSHVNSTTSELEKLKGIVRSHVKTTSAEFQRVERIVQSRFDSTSADIKEVKGFAESHVDSTSAEFEKVRGIVQSRVDSTSAEFEQMKGIVQSHVNSTSAEFKEVKGMVQSHVNSTSAEFKEVKGMIKSHRASTTSLLRNLNGIAQSHVTSAEFEEVKGMVQSHVNSTSAEFKEVKGTLTANQERTEKLLQELLERGVTHRGAENTP